MISVQIMDQTPKSIILDKKIPAHGWYFNISQ